MLKGERSLDNTRAEKHAILRTRAQAEGDAQHRPLHHSPLKCIGSQRADQRNQAGSRWSSTTNIRSAHICSPTRQRRNGRQGFKDRSGQDFGQDALQRSIPAIHSKEGHASASEAGKRFGHVCTRARRHMHDLGRVLKSLLECGRGSAAQTGVAITEKAQSHGSPGMQTVPSCSRAAPSWQASFLANRIYARMDPPTYLSSCERPRFLPGLNRPAAPTLDTGLAQAQRVKSQRTDGPDRNEPEAQIGTTAKDPERQ